METREIADYFRIIRKWWWVIALLVGATVGTMLAIALLSKEQYQATVTLQVSAPAPQEVPLYSQFGREALRDEIEQTRSSLNEFLLEGDAPYQVVEVLPEISMGGSELRARTTVDLPETSQLVLVRVRASDPETAALLANTLVEVGLEQYGQLLARPTANTRQFIERELEVALEDLRAAEAEFAQFQINNQIGDLSKAVNAQYELIRALQLQGDLARAEGGIARAQAIEEIVLRREAELQNIIALSSQYTELVDRADRARDAYNFLIDRRSEARIKENQILDLGSIQIITPARPPRRPVNAIEGKLVVLGAVASILMGVLLAFLLEYLQILGVFRGFSRRLPGSEAMTVPGQADLVTGSR